MSDIATKLASGAFESTMNMWPKLNGDVDCPPELYNDDYNSIKFTGRNLDLRQTNPNYVQEKALIESSQIKIELQEIKSNKAEESNTSLLNNNQISNEFASSVCGSTQPPFTQRHPFFSGLFGAIVTIFATPFLALGNAIISPFLMGAALISQVFGEGEIANRIGGWGLTKALMGVNASLLAKGKMSSWELLAMVVVIPYTILVGTMASAINVYISSQEFLNKINHDAKLDN